MSDICTFPFYLSVLYTQYVTILFLPRLRCHRKHI